MCVCLLSLLLRLIDRNANEETPNAGEGVGLRSSAREGKIGKRSRSEERRDRRIENDSLLTIKKTSVFVARINTFSVCNCKQAHSEIRETRDIFQDPTRSTENRNSNFIEIKGAK